jgi:hypothetical protein
LILLIFSVTMICFMPKKWMAQHKTNLDISQWRVEIISPTHGSTTLYSATPEMHKFLCILDG